MNRTFRDFKVLLGPVALLVGVALLLFPDFDKFEFPASVNELLVIEGKVTDSSSTKYANFIYVTNDVGETARIKIRCGCEDSLVGATVIAKVDDDFLNRNFSIAWELKKDGIEMYTLESEKESYGNLISRRKSMSMWMLFIGILVTPIWHLTKNKS